MSSLTKGENRMIVMKSMSHHEAVDELVKWHDATTPFAPENGESLKFNVGDKVTYVNDYGCEFHDRKITGIMNRKDDESLYCSGRRSYIDSDCPWMPVKESNLRPA